MAQPQTARPLRADAQHNRGRILAAARDAFVERGAGAPLDEIARRAGTGIATLYRRFPDREALMRAVVIDSLRQTAQALQCAIDEEPDAFRALVRYMHASLDIRTGAVIPALLDEISLEDEEMRRVRDLGRQPLQDLIERAHRDGTLRADVTSADIGTLIVRLSRPLPGSFPREVNDALGHRHLDLLVGGLRAGGPADISGPAMTLDDLREMRQEAVTRTAPAPSTAQTRERSSR